MARRLGTDAPIQRHVMRPITPNRIIIESEGWWYFYRDSECPDPINYEGIHHPGTSRPRITHRRTGTATDTWDPEVYPEYQDFVDSVLADAIDAIGPWEECALWDYPAAFVGQSTFDPAHPYDVTFTVTDYQYEMIYFPATWSRYRARWKVVSYTDVTETVDTIDLDPTPLAGITLHGHPTCLAAIPESSESPYPIHRDDPAWIVEGGCHDLIAPRDGVRNGQLTLVMEWYATRRGQPFPV